MREGVYSVWYVRVQVKFYCMHGRYRLSCIITMAYNSKHEHGITWEWLIWLSEAINADVLCVSFYYGHPFFWGHSYVGCTTVRHHNCKFRFDTAVLHVPILTPVVIHVPTPWIMFIYIYFLSQQQCYKPWCLKFDLADVILNDDLKVWPETYWNHTPFVSMVAALDAM